jgi:NAD(P)-dependent dehydrogenase (short-subunit alcohol dehydrogenase family)
MNAPVPPPTAGCPFHADRAAATASPGERKTMVLTGASRGIGHATARLFSEAGWRVITCSRQPFDQVRCPWDAGPDDHLQIDLADRRGLPDAVEALRARLGGSPLHALVNNAGISPKGPQGARLTSLSTPVET